MNELAAIMFALFAIGLFRSAWKLRKKKKPTSRLYILSEDGNPMLAKSEREWAEWRESNARERFVASFKDKDTSISTVFLGLDHNFEDDGKPLLYETVINGDLWDAAYLSATKEEAMATHERMVRTVFQLQTGINIIHQMKKDRKDEWK